MKKQVLILSLVLLNIIIIAQGLSLAQGGIQGKVTDPSNAPLADVKVTLSYSWS